MSKKRYKEFNKAETETTINILYNDNLLCIYTNKVSLQRKLNKLIGEPKKEFMMKNSIAGSCWEMSLEDKSKISKIIMKANIFSL